MADIVTTKRIIELPDASQDITENDYFAIDNENGDTGKIPANLFTSTSREAKPYDNTKTYAVGKHCIYQNKYYVCTTAIDTPEVWTPAHWEETNIGDEITELNNTLAGYGVRTLSDLGITTPCTVRQIVNALPSGCCVVISLSGGLVSDANYTGELYIRKASGSTVMHKTDLVIRTNASATTSLDGHYLIGMLPGTGNTVWYKPTLTAV